MRSEARDDTAVDTLADSGAAAPVGAFGTATLVENAAGPEGGTAPAAPDVRLYDTTIRHSRSGPVTHRFGARSYWWLVDVDALGSERGGTALPGYPAWTRALAEIRPADLDLDDAPTVGEGVRRLARRLAAGTGSTAGTGTAAGTGATTGTDTTTGTEHAWEAPPDVRGPALLATTGRVAGYGFDPLALVWLHAADGSPSAVLAVVRNTYGGLHHYLLRPDARGRAEVPKAFHVSPFNDAGGRYAIDVPEPGERLYVAIRLRREGEPDFVASVDGTRRPAGTRALLGVAARRPLEPLAVSARIRAHGIYLWARGLRIRQVPEGDTAAGRARAPIPPAPRGPLAAVLGLGVRAILAALVRGMPVRLEYPGGETRGGAATSAGAPRMLVHRPRDFHTRVGRHASIGLGESYMAGDWDSPELATLLSEFAARQSTMVPRPLRALRGLYIPRPPSATRGSVENARENISAHYDLSNRFFAVFLDETLTYSAALFDTLPERAGRLGERRTATSSSGDAPEEDTIPGSPTWDDLAPAQRAKIDALLDSAGVVAGSRVLEIGTGWGELCLRAAARGATVRSVTLSSEQRDLALRRAEEAGFGDRIEVELRDYRDVEGEYDAVVSVEMIEAVGLEYLGEYFRVIDGVLAPGGRVAIQAILMDDERVRTTRNNYTWMHKYVFPGGRIPSIGAMERALEGTSLRMRERRRFGLHYAETLRLWEERFTEREDEVRELGFDDVFLRMWRFYLQYSEAGFRSGYLDVAHLELEASR